MEDSFPYEQVVPLLTEEKKKVEAKSFNPFHPIEVVVEFKDTCSFALGYKVITFDQKATIGNLRDITQADEIYAFEGHAVSPSVLLYDLNVVRLVIGSSHYRIRFLRGFRLKEKLFGKTLEITPRPVSFDTVEEFCDFSKTYQKLLLGFANFELNKQLLASSFRFILSHQVNIEKVIKVMPLKTPYDDDFFNEVKAALQQASNEIPKERKDKFAKLLNKGADFLVYAKKNWK